MKVHVVGPGGREEALRFVLARTAAIVAEPDDADLVVIGPEAPLVAGLADELRREGKLVFGPGRDGAQIEGSKAWMKELLVDAGVPTAGYRAIEPGNDDDAEKFLRSLPGPWVVKTDYLAAGKGVLVTSDLDEAIADASRKLKRGPIVIEEYMEGPELSLLCVCDGRRAVPLAPARDYKRAGDGDTGPNTGGMGAFSPVPGIDRVAVTEEIVQPTLEALIDRGIDYRGVLYAGLMETAEGMKVVEYNCRFGDPEAQAVLPRYAGDLAELLSQAAAGEISTDPRFVGDACVTIALATEGYPESARTGDEIAGLAAAEAMEGVIVFRVAVEERDGALVTAGGRVLNVTALGRNLNVARTRAYEAAAMIRWQGIHYRTDIAKGLE